MQVRLYMKWPQGARPESFNSLPLGVMQEVVPLVKGRLLTFWMKWPLGARPHNLPLEGMQEVVLTYDQPDFWS